MRAYTYEAYDHHPSYDITGMPDSIALTSLSRMQHARSGYINPGLEMEKVRGGHNTSDWYLYDLSYQYFLNNIFNDTVRLLGTLNYFKFKHCFKDFKLPSCGEVWLAMKSILYKYEI